MKAVILAAGKGSRLVPLTYSKPKCLMPLANKPLIQYIVQSIMELEGQSKVDEIFIVTNYLENKLKDFFEEWSPDGIKITFVHQDTLGGTGDALKTLNGKINEDFILANGDEVFGPETFKIISEKFLEKRVLGVIGGMESKNPERYGVLVVNENDSLGGIVEKSPNPPGRLVSAGVYAFSPRIFEYLERINKSERGEYELTDAIIAMAEDTSRVIVSNIDDWISVTMLWDLFEANKKKIDELVEKNGKNVIIGKNVEIKPGVHIEGNVVIGDGAIIGPNCYIRGDTSIGKNCRIGNAVEIKNSIIMDNSKVPHLSYIGDSVIGETCNLGGGTCSANLRHDRENVKVLVKNDIIESGMHKIGFFMADYTKTGIGTMIYPGMVLGPFSWTAPNTTVSKNVEPFTFLDHGKKKKLDKKKIDTAVKNDDDKKFLKTIYEELKGLEY